MAVDVFEWEVEDKETCQYRVKAGHVTVEIEALNDASEWGVYFKWGDLRRYYELTEEESGVIEAAKYIAIGINAKIEAQRAGDE